MTPFVNRFKKPTIIVLILISVFSITCRNSFKCWSNNSPFFSDVDQYYSFLIAQTIHQDLAFNFPNNYWLIKTPTGKHIPKFSIGMAVMYSPFFYSAHFYTLHFSRQPADGYSRPYADALVIASFFYTLAGLYFLRKILLMFFDEWASALSILTIYLATNLLFYTLAWGLMPHNYLFFLFSAILYSTIKWHQTLKLKYVMMLSLSMGLTVLVRPAQIIVFIIPILYNIRSLSDIKEKINFLYLQKKHVLLGALCFLITILPQLLYWKWTSDSFLYFSYGDRERFFFDDPKIIEFFFSYRKGWLVYTPIMFFSLIGFIWRKKIEIVYLSILVYTFVSIYVLSCWWCWWFGGGFGMRTMVESYVFLALPLTSFISFCLHSWLGKLFVIVIISSAIYLNIVQIYQYKIATLHYDSMTKEVYWKIFGKWERTNEIIQFCEKHYLAPDYEKARIGIR